MRPGQILGFLLFSAAMLTWTMACCQATTAGEVAVENQISVKGPDIGLRDTEVELKIYHPNRPETVMVGGKVFQPHWENGQAQINIPTPKDGTIRVDFGSGQIREHVMRVLPGWASLIPPLVAILLAFLLKDVTLALGLGIFSALLLQLGFAPGDFLAAIALLVDTVIIDALTDRNHQSVILFSLMIGGMVGILQDNGGLRGIVHRLAPYARTARRSQLVTWLLGLLIFFDDYANTLIVGNTMRPLTDRFGVSRARLAYIVDSTSAPLAAIAFVTTWVGAEVGYIDQALRETGLELSAYGAFLHSLRYAYYPVLALSLVGLTILMRRDWPAMHNAQSPAETEEAAQTSTGDNPGPPAQRPRSLNALLPILTLMGVSGWGLVYTGMQAMEGEAAAASFMLRLADIMGQADAYKALLWGSLAALVMAFVSGRVNSSLSLHETSEAMLKGFRQMMDPLVILVLAWGLSAQTQVLDTGTYLASLFPENVSPAWIPALLFMLSGVVAFSTGSSWGTMALVYPLFLGPAYTLGLEAGWEASRALELFFQSASVVLAGAVFGDHCSPISDTTILSSLASGCHHLEHVRTQLPYALATAGCALLLGTLPASFFPSIWPLGYFGGLAMLVLLLRFTARPVT